MAFRYLAGVTTAGAPDEIVDWFQLFQAWMTGIVGWTVAAGGGTTDIYFQSVGEGPGPPLTMLFIHVWRDGGNPNRVRIEVSDDVVPTHQTAEGSYLDGLGAQFAYWMCGDLDAINICFRGGATYNSVYAGMVIPFALTVPDETYRMISTSTQATGSILRDAGGVWDVDHALVASAIMVGARVDRYDGSLPLCAIVFDTQANIAGQLKHIGGRITEPSVTVMDVLTTGLPGATTTWIVLEDRAGTLYPMRTGGILPAGMPDPGTFAAVSGVAANYPALWTAITAHLTGLGWTFLGDPVYRTHGRLYHSTGESTEEDIYIGYAVNTAPADEFYPYVQDDALATHMFPINYVRWLDSSEFPINYWICGDRDCCILVYQRPTGYTLIWSGLVPAFAPGLLPPYAAAPLTDYSLWVGMQGDGVGGNMRAGLVRAHDGTWGQDCGLYDDGAMLNNSNPNNFDGTTFQMWPLLAYQEILAGQNEFIGQLRYVGRSSGGGIASMDTITIGAQVYTVFFDNTGLNFCVRTV